MNKILLLAAAAAISVEAMAQATVYTYDDNGEMLIGAMRRVSDGGKYAVGGDDYLDTGSFIVNVDDPLNFDFTDEGFLMDVSDDGMAVGTWFEKYASGAQYSRAAIYKDGVWTRLPHPDDGRDHPYSTASAISTDSRYIAGCISSPSAIPGMSGGRFPILWELNDQTGEYEVNKLFNDLYLPGAMGFIVYDMSSDGRYIVGGHNLNMGSYIPAIVDTQTGELIEFNELGTTELAWEYRGEIYYDEVMTVDGVVEDGQFFSLFTYATEDYAYGSRDIVVDAETGEIDNVATVYCFATGEFFDGNADEMYLCGQGEDNLFTTDGSAYIHDKYTTLEALTGSSKVAGIYSLDSTGKVMTGSSLFTLPTGDLLEAPLLIIFDESPLAGIADIEAIPATDATIYDLQGRRVVNPATGIYIQSGKKVIKK